MDNAHLLKIEMDPEIVAAVADVDRSLLAWFATLSPLERLQYVTRQTRAICEAGAASRLKAPPDQTAPTSS